MGKDGAIKKLLKASLVTMLNAEITETLGYEKNSAAGNNSGNSRNGTSPKRVKTNQGEVNLNLSRDHNGEYSPLVVGKH